MAADGGRAARGGAQGRARGTAPLSLGSGAAAMLPFCPSPPFPRLIDSGKARTARSPPPRRAIPPRRSDPLPRGLAPRRARSPAPQRSRTSRTLPRPSRPPRSPPMSTSKKARGLRGLPGRSAGDGCDILQPPAVRSGSARSPPPVPAAAGPRPAPPTGGSATSGGRWGWGALCGCVGARREGEGGFLT